MIIVKFVPINFFMFIKVAAVEIISWQTSCSMLWSSYTWSSIFAKTGVSRQSMLVSLMLKSVVTYS